MCTPVAVIKGLTEALNHVDMQTTATKVPHKVCKKDSSHFTVLECCDRGERCCYGGLPPILEVSAPRTELQSQMNNRRPPLSRAIRDRVRAQLADGKRSKKALARAGKSKPAWLEQLELEDLDDLEDDYADD